MEKMFIIITEHSSKLKPHAVTSYNEAACHRAMGRYTRARGKFREALARNRTEVEGEA